MTHQCDPGAPLNAGMITKARLYRVLLAFARSQTEEEVFSFLDPVMYEVDQCPRCLTAMLIASVGMTLGFMPDARFLDAFEQQLADALDETAGGDASPG